MASGRVQRRKKTSPIFGELSEYEDDQWWKNLFLEMSDGIFPYKVNYNNSTLFYKLRNGKYENLTIDTTIQPKKLLAQLKTFFLDVVGLLPSEFFDVIAEREKGKLTWKEINKNETTRSVAIWAYLKTLDLNDDEFVEIERIIWWGFAKNLWMEKTFTIKNNRITNFDPEIVNFVKPKRGGK